jgi:hypothetical protein
MFGVDHSEGLEVFDDGCGVLVLLLGGVGVVKAQDHAALVHLSVVVVEQGCLAVIDKS